MTPNVRGGAAARGRKLDTPAYVQETLNPRAERDRAGSCEGNTGSPRTFMLVTESGSRRRSDRVPLDVLVELRTSGRDEALLEADGLNVSEGGMAMRSPRAPAAGTRLECRFHCPPDGEVVCAQAEVVWSSTRGATIGSFGLRFIELDTKSATCLRRLIPAGARPPARDERRVATLCIDGLAAPVEAELKLADETRIVLEQRLSFLQLGRGVEVSVLGRGRERGRIASVELRQNHHDVPTVVYRVLLEGAAERAADAVCAAAQPFAPADDPSDRPDEPIELVRSQVARTPRPRRSDRTPPNDAPSEPFHDHAAAYAQPSEAPSIDVAHERTSDVPATGTRSRRVSSWGRTTTAPTTRTSQPPPTDRASQPPALRGSQPPAEEAPGATSPRSTMLGLDAAWVKATAAEADAAEEAARAAPLPADDHLAEESAQPALVASTDRASPPRVRGVRDDDADATDDPRAAVVEADDSDEDARAAKPAGLLAQAGQVPLHVGRLMQALLRRMRALTGREDDDSGSDDVKTWLLLQVARVRGAVIALYQRATGGTRNVRNTKQPARLRMQRSTLPGVGPAEDGRDDTPRRVRIIAWSLAVVGIALGIYAVAPVSGAPMNLPASSEEPLPEPEPTMSEELTMEVEPPVDAPSQPGLSHARNRARRDESKTLATTPIDEVSENVEPDETEIAATDEGGSVIENTATRFGFATVPNGRTFVLRMNGPVKALEGSQRDNGFSVRVLGCVAVDPAKPISSAHRAVVRSAAIRNKGTFAELTIDFVPGLEPRFQVVAKHDTLEITLERIDGAR